ncbi:lysostaphin resistance A-like protein [Bacillales bacterium AN1005]|uniref:CPBP family intramembrane glutamic endopeptidase n=1 Tax=Niallia taxi TaxID=2499688 RepID=UPI0021A6566D|nr:type II CAAX endopeptidase family protein [Niallia taxi]MCT2345292.1 CPBP family intramembrane metalloprotease [Niallia taxi]
MNKEKYFNVLNQLTDKELVKHLYITQIILIILSVGLGIFVFHMEDFGSLLLFKWTYVLAGLSVGAAVVFMDMIFMKYIPGKYHDDGGLNKRIFRQRHPVHIAVIAAVVSVSEEILFRGVIQTNLGLLAASIIFAVVHYRYLFNWFLFINIIFISLIIGCVYLWTGSLLATIIMHFTIDFSLGLLIRYKVFE